MIRFRLLAIAALAAIMSIAVPAANAVEILSSTVGGILQDTTPADGLLDNWTGTPLAPVSGNTDVWVIKHAMTNTTGGPWYGGTTRIDTGGTLDISAASLTARNVILNAGGQILADVNSSVTRALTGDVLTLNGGAITKGRKITSFALNF